MADDPRVYVMKRPCKGGKVVYHLRWVDATTHKWRSRRVGTDSKHAEREAAILEREMGNGSYRDLRGVTWAAFVDEHCQKLPGDGNRAEARRTLEEFSRLEAVTTPKAVTFGRIESYVLKLKSPEHGNTVATVNKKLRYIRAALNKAVKRGYLAVNPMSLWEWQREEEVKPRIIDPAEETALLAAANDLYGPAFRGFIFVALNTGGRRSELLGLTWDRITLDGKEPQVHFANTKGKRDRLVPLTPEAVMELRKLKASTQVDGGPFITVAEDLDDRWTAILAKAGLAGITPHDCRRTFVTRLIRAGVPLPTVQKLAGHSSIQTTLGYYNWVSSDDMKAGIQKLRKANAAG